MALHKLSARKVDAAAPGKHEDGGGLRLVVSPTGAKKWVLRVTIRGKRREMGLGTYPDVTLATARDEAVRFRSIAKAGGDPIAERTAGKRQTPTFTSCAAQYIRSQRHGWRNAKHQRQWVRTLKTYARPVIGKRLVNEITTEDILQILSPIWTTKNETAKRVQGRIENVLDFAAAHGFRAESNPARWRGHLDKLLPKPTRVRSVTHHPAMPYFDVPAYMDELRSMDGIAPKALRFLILTATRTNEVRFSTWGEINLTDGTWIIPAGRMKSRREHRVPLASEAMEILDELPNLQDNPYLFPGMRERRPLSNMALLNTMRRSGFGVGGVRGNYVPHGFRSSFRDWSGEVSSFPRDVAEMALAHVIQNKVEAAYRRGDLFQKRRTMMQEWADYLTTRD
ncbi:integrase arm-type DNA-binding domain-containing protein [Thioalkalivibrio sp. ALJ2]|uniref:tyrosine-type recombinase/integrase n=1 Tax=Thioalkalivibrio sp. ALJ2 TaxID=1261622 RepID=UPI0004770301|nr:integrase arm-type DNA-binding domain-containing protein [Thioalkalivibrio sp. ALJ2]